jgi:uncharacterized membrane protein
MKHHPLKIISLIAVTGQILNQLSLLYWIEGDIRYILAPAFALPLLFPLSGLLREKLYTYRWTGFLTLLYFLIGVSEAFTNPDLRLYGVLTLFFSIALFLSVVYYSRYLAFKVRRS